MFLSVLPAGVINDDDILPFLSPRLLSPSLTSRPLNSAGGVLKLPLWGSEAKPQPKSNLEHFSLKI